MNFFKRRSVYFLVIGLYFILLPRVYADDLSAPLEKVKLPNKQWVWQNTGKEDQKILHPEATGQAVNVRVHTYRVPISAEGFMGQVRLEIIKNPDYEGATISEVGSKKLKNQNWAFFNISRKDEIKQEIWARKSSDDVVLMVIYTGAGSYFQKYYEDCSKLLKNLS